MRLHIYHALDGEIVPDDVTHVIVDDSVTVIKKQAFSYCELLVSLIMDDNVKRIEEEALSCCRALRFLRLSKALEYIGNHAFYCCVSLEALFLPSTVNSIGKNALKYCRSMRLLILPHDMDLNNIGMDIIIGTAVYEIAKASGVRYELDRAAIRSIGYVLGNAVESNRRVNEWLFHHMDEAPFHKLCYNSPITTKDING